MAGKKSRDKTNVMSNNTLNIKLENAKKDKASLRQMNGKFIGRKYPINKGSTLVGRDPGLDITIQEESVSRRHAEMIFDGETLQVVDLDSTNGTYVNDKPIKNKTASQGDLIRFGSIVFKYIPSGSIETVFHDELHNLAHLDGLTGCYNRKYIIDYMETEVKRCQKLEIPFSMLIFDLDHFKKVNDTYGHLAGDYVLKETVKLFKEKVLRASDVLGRYGGEEFCIILSEAPIRTATDIAERLRKAVERHNYIFDGNKMDITISIGVASMKAGDAAVTLLETADKALYKAKESGRNKVCS
ncbi:MAG: GGDEF domain-containing protein [Proteobacteria bacterium]|nr:GGDEF domain-containing protein [Pseudomonadota bacterium]